MDSSKKVEMLHKLKNIWIFQQKQIKMQMFHDYYFLYINVSLFYKQSNTDIAP